MVASSKYNFENQLIMNLVIESIFTSSIKNPTGLYNCRWLDKLGASAKEGMGVVMRQTFSKGNNALTDSNNLPNPVSSHGY